MFCPKCSKIVDDDSQFCPFCGTSIDSSEMRLKDADVEVLKVEEKTPEPPEKFCGNCGAHLSEDAKFCPNCGIPTEQKEVAARSVIPERANVFANKPEPPMPSQRFCGKCGAPLSPDMKFCGVCGTSVDGLVSSPKKQVNRHLPTQRQMRIWIIAVVLVAIVAASAIFAVTQFTGFNGLAKTVMSAYIDYDIDKLLNVVGDMYYTGSKQEAESYFKSVVNAGLDTIEQTTGPKVDFSYKINDIYDMSNKRAESLLDDISSRYQSFDPDSISKIVVAEVTVYGKGREDNAEVNLMLIMCKEGGAYHLLEIE